jgi:hypothetical protein
MTNTTISLNDAAKIIGVEPRKHLATGRQYFNVPGAAYSLYWINDKLHFALTKGRSSDDATQAAKNVLGCSIIDRRTQAAAYCVVQG